MAVVVAGSKQAANFYEPVFIYIETQYGVRTVDTDLDQSIASED